MFIDLLVHLDGVLSDSGEFRTARSNVGKTRNSSSGFLLRERESTHAFAMKELGLEDFVLCVRDSQPTFAKVWDL